ncbi:helix-turn-helix domain-containing protein, partial [Pseudomonas shirazensis]
RITRADLPVDFIAQLPAANAPVRVVVPNVTPIRPSRAGDERADVLEVLQTCRWNMSAAARELGICRPSLYRVLRRLDIPPLKEQLALDACRRA